VSEDVLMPERDEGGTAWKATPYLNSPANEHAVRFSPDGKWVLFCSVESGRHELYAQRFTGAGSGPQDAAAGRVQVSTSGHDGSSWWSLDGKEIRYIDAERQVMSVQVQTEPAFSVSLPKMLYSLKDVRTRSGAWCPDGRLLGALEGENERPNRIGVVVNFMDEVRAKLPDVK
jgi:Tol biopolymer transport system component